MVTKTNRFASCRDYWKYSSLHVCIRIVSINFEENHPLHDQLLRSSRHPTPTLLFDFDIYNYNAERFFPRTVREWNMIPNNKIGGVMFSLNSRMLCVK